jgi:hypothetical protein
VRPFFVLAVWQKQPPLAHPGCMVALPIARPRDRPYARGHHPMYPRSPIASRASTVPVRPFVGIHFAALQYSVHSPALSPVVPYSPCKPRFANMHRAAAPIRYISQPQFSSRIVHFGHPGSKILNLFISFFQFFFFQLNFEKAIHNWEPYLSRRDGYIPEPVCIVRSVPGDAYSQMGHCRATQGTIGVPVGTTTANHRARGNHIGST